MAHPLTVAGVFAHPHDETWSLAGVFALLQPKGVRGAVWTATRGQAGDVAYQLLGHQGTWRQVFVRSAFIRVQPAPGPDDPPETSLVEAFAAEGRPGG